MSKTDIEDCLLLMLIVVFATFSICWSGPKFSCQCICGKLCKLLVDHIRLYLFYRRYRQQRQMRLLNFQKSYRKLGTNSGLKPQTSWFQFLWEGMRRRIKCEITLIKKQPIISYVGLSRWALNGNNFRDASNLKYNFFYEECFRIVALIYPYVTWIR